MALSQTGSRDVVVVIKDSIKQYAKSKNIVRPKPRKVMRRVPQAIRELNPTFYTASEFSVGLFDRCPLDSLRTKAAHYKVVVATAVLEVLGMTETDWEGFCSMVIPDPEEIQAHYDELERNPFSLRELQSLLTLDAVFVAGYLGARYHHDLASLDSSLTSTLDKIIDENTLERIVEDLRKVENQIPLSVIRAVLRILMEKAGVRDLDAHVECAMGTICWKVVPPHALPGYKYRSGNPDAATDGLSFLECETFLEYAYRAAMWDVKESQEGDSTRHDAPRVHLPCATELRKAGIEFRGREGFHDIEFKAGIFKGILYLPTLHIYDSTEKVWRNLVAYEQLANDNKGDFALFLSFMDDLVDTPNDVMLLRSGRFPPILVNGLGTNEALANLFNRFLQHCFIKNKQKWTKLRQEIHDFYNKGERQMYLEFMETYFGKPWLTISVVAATILLIMTFLQTYYTLAEYYHT